MEPVDVVVVGGGLAGWVAAATAAGAGRSVRLLDPSDRGGRAATDTVQGFRLNRGAHAVYEGGPGLAVLARLGIDPAGHTPPVKGARALLRDQVGLLPSSPSAVIRTSLLSVRERARIARLFSGIGRLTPADVATLSTNQWFDALGLSGNARSMAAMFVRLATYAADHDALSADAAVAQLQFAMKGVRYVDGGWATLIDALRATATRRGASVSTTRVQAVVPADTSVEVTTTAGPVDADAVVLAAGSPDTCAHLLPAPPAAWSDLGPAAVASCLDVGLDHVTDLTSLLGVDRPLYAIRHSPPAELAPEGSSLVHAMQYLRADQHVEPAAARSALEHHLRAGGVDLDRAVVSRYLHRMTVVSALSTPERGGLAGRPGIDSAGFPRVVVAGDWVGPTGHLADASIASGAAAGARAASLVGVRAEARS